LDEATLFSSTSLGQASVEREMGNAAATLALRRSRAYSSPPSNANQGEGEEGGSDGDGGSNGGGDSGTGRPTSAFDGEGGEGPEGQQQQQPQQQQEQGEEVATLAAQRALVGEVLHRNASQLHLLPRNPGARHADRTANMGGSSWEAVKDGPTSPTHFHTKDGLQANVDAAMDMVADPSTYNVRNTPLLPPPSFPHAFSCLP
jgi:hypothetical protein